MNAGFDLAGIGTGLPAPTFDSQRVFRAALHALAHPGEITAIDVGVEAPPGLHPAAAALLLSLLDQDTRLWVGPALRDAVAPYLRFHTGCVPVSEIARADFALAADPAELPPLADFAQGDADYPDRSTTVVLQVRSLGGGRRYTLQGPGINDAAEVAIDGLDDRFVAEWNAQQRTFPCGIDVFVVAARTLLGLPRTTRIGV